MIRLPCPLVTQAELDAWPAARELLKAGEGDLEASIALRNKLIVSVYPLIFRIVGRHSAARPGVDFYELYEAAINGLFNATNSYEPGLGSWKHWATVHARQQMLRVMPAEELLTLDAKSGRSSRETILDRLIGACTPTETNVALNWLNKNRASLDGLEHEIIVKCVIGDEEMSSVAFRHDISRQWVHLKKKRALKKLKRLLDDHPTELY